MWRFLMTIGVLLAYPATAGAQRVLEELERAVELTMTDVKLPAAEGGTITFKPCPACAFSTHRTMDTTVFRANGTGLPLGEFLRVVEDVQAQSRTEEDTALVTVFIDIASGRVTRVALRY